MRFQPSVTFRMVLIAIALALIGCSNEARTGLAPLGPNAQSAQAVTADPNATRIDIPFVPGNFVGGVQNPSSPSSPAPS